MCSRVSYRLLQHELTLSVNACASPAAAHEQHAFEIPSGVDTCNSVATRFHWFLLTVVRSCSWLHVLYLLGIRVSATCPHACR